MTVETSTLTEGPAWVDHSTHPIDGLFPLAVEQYLNSAVAVNAPGVTTVTNSARYYALHPLIADEAARRGLDGPRTVDLLRRAEVAYGLICIAHESSPTHQLWYPDPHGCDRLQAALASGKVELAVAAGEGEGRYANARWGFLGPYQASEVSLGLLGAGFTPGPAYDRKVIHGELGAVFELIDDRADLDPASLAPLGALCVCQTDKSNDGALLASRFAGRADDLGTVAGNIGQIMRLFAVAMSHGEIHGQDDLGNFVMFDPLLTEHPQSTNHWLRWRGIRTRMASVHAWRLLFSHVCRYLNDPKTVAQLGQQLASELPTGTVGSFVDDLPQVVGSDGAPLPAELTVADRPAPESYLATIALGAQRLRAFDDTSNPVRLGFTGPPGHRFEAEELAPQWVANVIDDWRQRPMDEFAHWLTKVMVNRAHRVTMAKSRMRRDGRYIMPGRILVQDDLVVRRGPETTSPPPLRWSQLLSMGRQTGIFQVSDAGRWEVGARGHLVV